MPQFPIRELSKLTGYSPAMIRYFEKAGLVSTPARTNSGYRLFDASHVKELRFVAEMQRLGFYADQIRALHTVKSSNRSSDEKRAAIEEIYTHHAKYVKDKARHFADMQAKLEAKASRFVEEILADDC